MTNGLGRVRPAALDDLPGLLRLEEEGFDRDRYGKRQMRYYLQRPANFTLFVWEEAGAVAGSAIMGWRKGARVGHLYSIVAAPGNQRKGVGSKLLEACESVAAARGCERIVLEVRRQNTAAVTFYERRGYAIIKSVKNYYVDDDALHMAKRLA